MALSVITATAVAGRETGARLIGQVQAAAPDGGAAPPPGMGDITLPIGWLKYIAGAVAVVAFIAAGIMLFFHNRSGQASEGPGKFGWIIAGILAIGCASGVVGAFGL